MTILRQVFKQSLRVTLPNTVKLPTRGYLSRIEARVPVQRLPFMTAATTCESKATILPKLNFKLGAAEILSECRKSIETMRGELDRIGSIPVDECTFERVMRPWSLAEARFTTEIASYNFPQYVSPSAEIRDASVEATRMIDEFNIETSMREDLFQVARAVSEREKDSLVGEEGRFLEKVLLEFKHNGLFLESAESRAELKKKRQRLADLSTDFSKNMNDDATELLFTPEELDGATPDFLASLERDESGDRYRVTMKYPDLFGVLRNVKSEAVRAKMDETNGRKCEANRAIFTEALRLRHECAQLLGYPDHAHFRLEDKMARDPQKVTLFLEDLRRKLEPFARKEIEKLRELKARDLGREDVEVRSWDYQFYTRILLEQEYSIDEERVREYFSLSRVIAAMLEIFEQVLGLRFQQVPGAFEKGLVWHEDVSLWEVWNSEAALREFPEDDEFVGHFYLDLFPRPGKYTHAACWDLQPGYSEYSNDASTIGSKRQYPVAGMVANFTKPTGDRPSLLKHDEVVTLFHELGHAMHDMCARVRLSRFHGTSVEGDFVEAPSQMLENWCWNADLLAGRLSQHYQRLEETLPIDLATALTRTKNLNAGILNLRQIFFATWDLTVHSATDPGGRFFIPGAADEAYEKMRAQIALIPQPPGVWPAASFGHMMGGYDAGYYGYLWSQVFSADMFYSRFAKHLLSDPLTPGIQYRKSVLRVGGSRDGIKSLIEFLGREPIPEPFLKSLGLNNDNLIA